MLPGRDERQIYRSFGDKCMSDDDRVICIRSRGQRDHQICWMELDDIVGVVR